MPFSIPTLHVTSPPSERCHIHGARTSQLRPNTTSSVRSRTLIPGLAWRNAVGPARALFAAALRRVLAESMTKRTSWHSAPTMNIMTEAEPGRRRGAQRWNQTPREETGICCLHRRMIVRLGPGWPQKSTTSPPMLFSDASTKPRLLPRSKTRKRGIHSAQHTTTMPSQPRKTEEEEEDKVQLRMPSWFDLGDHGGGGVRGACAGTVGILGNLWWRMQLR